MAGNQHRQDYKKVRALRELFHGRFSENDITILLNHCKGNQHAALTFILEREPRELRQEVEQEQDRLAREAAQRGRQNCSNQLLDEARQGKINTEANLFACRACDKFWWRITPQRKQVSRCNTCGRIFDRVNPDKWWGWAEFHCTYPACGNTFYGWCHMEVASPCYKCGTRVLPTRIMPPRKTKGPRTRNQHSCDECAPHFVMPGAHGDHGAHGAGRGRVFDRRLNPRNCRCAHPPTRKALGLPLVIDESIAHDSSGSTVATFLPQGNLMRNYVDIDDLETIAEDSDSDA